MGLVETLLPQRSSVENRGVEALKKSLLLAANVSTQICILEMVESIIPVTDQKNQQEIVEIGPSSCSRLFQVMPPIV